LYREIVQSACIDMNFDPLFSGCREERIRAIHGAAHHDPQAHAS
jgi:hypothetical protein